MIFRRILACAAVAAILTVPGCQSTSDVQALEARINQSIDEKVKVKTAFIKTLTVDAQTLLSRAKSEPVKAACKKVFEAVRYSDPMSADSLSDVESRIRTEFDSFTDAVISDNADAATVSADELLTLLKERNSKCKMEK